MGVRLAPGELEPISLDSPLCYATLLQIRRKFIARELRTTMALPNVTQRSSGVKPPDLAVRLRYPSFVI